MIAAAKPNTLEMKSHSPNKIVWIGLIVLSFMAWWPLGLAMIAYLLWSGKMKCRHSDRTDDSQHYDFRMFFNKMGKGCCSRHYSNSTGNSAFDEYRNETLRRLEEDQREFVEFLDRLRRARDRAEFDQFMAERNHRPDSNSPSEAAL